MYNVVIDSNLLFRALAGEPVFEDVFRKIELECHSLISSRRMEKEWGNSIEKTGLLILFRDLFDNLKKR